MATINLKKRSATAIKNSFWEEFLDSLSSELELLRTKISEKEDFFNVRVLTDQDRLIEISKSFGFNIDRSIDTTTQYLKNNLFLTTARIKHKTTYTGYHYIFSLADYFGLVYNYFGNEDILTRGYDFDSVITNLNAISNYALPFKGFTPELYYKVSSTTGITLDYDPEWFLDGSTVLTLDQDDSRDPTIHLALEYIPESLILDSGTYYYMNTTYLDYLNNAGLYNKKVTEIIHAGVQVNGIMDLSGYFDNLSHSTYSTPNLKLNAVTTMSNYYQQTDTIRLDVATGNPGNMDFDLETPWVLDQFDNRSFTNTTLEDTFNYFSVGNNWKGVMSRNYPDLNQDLIGYWDFDETSGSTFYDTTINNYDGTLYGGYSRGIAIIGQGVSYNGSTAYGKAEDIIIDPSGESLSFWIKGLLSNQIVSGDITLIHLYNIYGDYLQVQYNTITKNITISMTGNTLVYNYELLDNSDHHIVITYNSTTSEYELFIDAVSVGTQSFGISIPAFSNYNLYVATDQTTTEFFTGYIDEIRFYSRILTDNEIEYLYDSRLGNVSSLANTLYTRTTINIRDENSEWYIVACRLDFSNEFTAIINDNVTYPTQPEKKNALNSLYEENVIIKEIGIFNSDDEMKIYCYWEDPLLLKKKNHISFQFYVKKS